MDLTEILAEITRQELNVSAFNEKADKIIADLEAKGWQFSSKKYYLEELRTSVVNLKWKVDDKGLEIYSSSFHIVENRDIVDEIFERLRYEDSRMNDNITIGDLTNRNEMPIKVLARYLNEHIVGVADKLEINRISIPMSDNDGEPYHLAHHMLLWKVDGLICAFIIEGTIID